MRVLNDTLESDTSSRSAADVALQRRYGPHVPDTRGLWNDVLAGLIGHRSVRSYLPKALPPGTIEIAIAAAQSAASSSNLQAWSVVVVEDDERKSRLADLAGAQAHIRQAPLFLVWLADLSRAERLFQHSGRAGEALPYLETFLVAVIDAALAAQNAVVALESLGLGAVYIGAIRNRPQAVAAELGLPAHVAPVFGLCVGYPDPATPAQVKPRLGQGVVVHRERYSADGEKEGIAVYDATLRRFQEDQSLPATGWIQAVVNRLGSIAALKGRDKLVEVLRALGHELR
ncbi:NADPH-dependent oxidoreductase [Bradyrhizobium sp. U87765 SZCCT0131]|nr:MULTISPECIES: NADPH-dependent oxidoreductase [unclassified Bradyrhizobium]MBR1221562.1 NADPH-dependent oxidoreductase [Bradyrhizobium sp. U87765 SZCCT0131]MBR1264515.1 NADPH-dependent oxidoreductase [Bradyrhizobium sp. U87765 SZCCT0134]MBR1304578.1 NADPH-dependent oxidoreductase [Bradyrhizobium sp. U87765 SZCCT0110]MBR1322565.1 NADPH-dependent oxidoreductase [Bradyrhizobium sp. U87765 SZCCT0109]MBR1346507.1 NADPH-dependent oxidoreductase [Bradyrhizobium sp. U87765 SZCCT0048]